MKSSKRHLVVGLLLLIAAACSTVKAQTNSGPVIKEPLNAGTTDHMAKLAESYGKLPLSFESNRGQTDRRVKFLSRGSGYSLFLTGNAAILALRKLNPARKQAPGVPPAHAKAAAPATTDFLRMSLVGANPAVRVSGTDELPGKSNYLIGNDSAKWQTNVPTYAKVRYEEVYDGVNLVYYGNQRRLEYDFVVAAGADPKVIRLRFGGAETLRIDEQGALVLETGSGAVRFDRPQVYQEIDGKRRAVAGKYALSGKRTIAFEVGSYDRTRPLVIDPVLVYEMFFGGWKPGAEGLGIAVDSLGSAYVTGDAGPDASLTNSLGCPSPEEGTAFVAKISADGSAILWSTYLCAGGTAIAVDSSHNVYITGGAGVGFPLVNPIYSTPTNSMVAKINASGSALVYSTYLGGSGDDITSGVAVDPSGNVYVTGTTNSTDFPTINALQTKLVGTANAFITKINASGSALVYSTYLGGAGGDEGRSVAVDSSGNAYITGATGPGFPMVSALQSADHDQGDSAFVAKISASGSTLVYSTYLGGSFLDEGNGIAVDSSGNAYITGSTSSSDFPTVNAIQPSRGTSVDSNAFVTEINASGSALIYSTFLGGGFLIGPGQEPPGGDFGSSVAVDSTGNAYITGTAISYDFPSTNVGAAGCSQLGDAFITEISAGGSALASSSCFGPGNDSTYGTAIAVDSSDNIYITGSSFGNGALIAKLTGTVLAPIASISPANVSFGDVAVGGNSAIANIVVTNTGTDGLVIGYVPSISSPFFIITNACGLQTIAPQMSCTIQFQFSPTISGPASVTVSIPDNAASSPQTVVLRGTGIPPGPIVTLSLTSVVFPTQNFGTPSAAQSVTLRNTGNASLNIQALAIAGANPGDFATASGTTCTGSSSVAPNGSCAIELSFTPTALGTRNATVIITDNAADSPESINLSGTTAVTPLLSATPSVLSFPGQYVGTSGLPQSVSVTNNGNAPLNITGVSASATDFAVINSCGSIVAAGTSCSVSVFFDPTTGGARSGTLTINDNAPGSPQTVALSGTGENFTLAPMSSTSTTVAPGQTANFSVVISPAGGFNQSVAFTCSGAPTLSTCVVTPGSVALNGSAAATVNVTLATTGALLPVGGPVAGGGYRLLVSVVGLLGLALLIGSFRWCKDRRLRFAYGLALPLFFLCAGVIMSACAGGSSSGGVNQATSGTPAGNYTLVVTGTFTSGSTTLTHSTNLTVLVQ